MDADAGLLWGLPRRTPGIELQWCARWGFRILAVFLKGLKDGVASRDAVDRIIVDESMFWGLLQRILGLIFSTDKFLGFLILAFFIEGSICL